MRIYPAPDLHLGALCDLCGYFVLQLEFPLLSPAICRDRLLVLEFAHHGPLL